jgi:WD40 repeat protein
MADFGIDLIQAASEREGHFVGHKGPVTAVAFADDGRLATAGADGTVRVWTPGVEVPQVLEGHRGFVWAVAWSASGLLASAGDDRSVRIWNRTGLQVLALEGHHARVRSIAWSTDGRLASACDDGVVRIWSGEGKLLRAVEGHSGPVLSVAWSSWGVLVSTGQDGTVRTYTQGLLSTLLRGRRGWFHAATWSAENRLATPADDGKVYVWDARGQPIAVLECESNAATCAAWGQDGTMASSGEDGMVRIWNKNGALLETIKVSDGVVKTLAWARDGRIATAGPDGSVRLLGADRKPLAALEGHRSVITALAWSGDGRLASSGQDGTILLWSSKGERLGGIKTDHGTVQGLAWAADGRLAAACDDNTVRVWGTDGRLIRRLSGPGKQVQSVAWAPDGRLAAAWADGTLRTWDPAWKPILRTKVQGAQARALAWSPQGHLAVGCQDGTLCLWAPDRLEPLVVQGHRGLVTCVAWGPEGQLASCGHDGTVRTWNAAGQAFNVFYGHTGYVLGIAWAPDGRMASAGSDRTIRVWGGEGEPPMVLEGHRGAVTCLAWSPHGPLASASGGDGMLRIWGSVSGEPKDGETRLQTAKVVLLGDQSVGKSTLAHRIVTGKFAPQASTHGQRTWLVDKWQTTTDGVQRQVFLWDLAGQPDYRIVHALFVDDAHVALVLFEGGGRGDQLAAPRYWARVLSPSQRHLLIASKVEQGEPALTRRELEEFCKTNGFDGCLSVGCETSRGIAELERRVQALLPWPEIPIHIANSSWQRLRNAVVRLRNDTGGQLGRLLVSLDDAAALAGTDSESLLAVVGALEIEGYVRMVRDADGIKRILLVPEILNNLMASVIVRARSADFGGHGAIDEGALLKGHVPLHDAPNLNPEERQVLLHAALATLQQKQLCFREERDGRAHLVFPPLVDELPPAHEQLPAEAAATYVASGNVEHLYAVLVVRLRNTGVFADVRVWRDQTWFIDDRGEACILRRRRPSEGELEMEFACTAKLRDETKGLFRGLVERVLEQRLERMEVQCYDPAFCQACAERVDFEMVRRFLGKSRTAIRCPNMDCHGTVQLMGLANPIRVRREEDAETRKSIEAANDLSNARSRFEQACTWLKAYVAKRDGDSAKPPTCFVTYAWSEPVLDRKTREIARDLRAAGVEALLDWYESHIGDHIDRFSDRAADTDFVACIGTPAFRSKFTKPEGSTVQQEWLHVANRLREGVDRKETILPLLLTGDLSRSFPPSLHGIAFADLRDDRLYFAELFDVLLKIHGINKWEPAVDDLRASLRVKDMVLSAEPFAGVHASSNPNTAFAPLGRNLVKP